MADSSPAPTPPAVPPEEWYVEVIYHVPAASDMNSEVSGLKYRSGPFSSREVAEQFVLNSAGHSERLRGFTVEKAGQPRQLPNRLSHLN